MKEEKKKDSKKEDKELELTKEEEELLKKKLEDLRKRDPLFIDENFRFKF